MSLPHHDIVIVGAGPAGSTAASFLAKIGRDVLLIDQHKFPRDKACGDCVGPYALRILHEIGLKDVINQAGFHTISSGRIVAPSGQDIGLRFADNHVDGISTLIAPRKKFDHLIQKRALDLGARFMVAKVRNIEKHDGQSVRIILDKNDSKEALMCRILLAADGSNSLIAKNLNGPYPATRMAVAARACIKGIRTNPHTIEGFLDPNIWPGYGWIFPTGPDAANVGVGLSLNHFRSNKTSLRQLVMNFLDIPAIKSRLSQTVTIHSFAGWPLRLGWHPELRRSWDGILLLGDAAGLINPLSGGGIANAILSGKIAAEVSIEALRKDDTTQAFLSRYESKLGRILRKELTQSEWLRKIIYVSPNLVNGAIRLLRSGSVLPNLLSRLYPDLNFHIT